MTEIFSSMPHPKLFYATDIRQKQPIQKTVARAAEIIKDTPVDKVELQKQESSGGIIKSIKRRIASTKKFFANVYEYTAGTLKGVRDGIVYGSLAYTGGAIANHFKTTGRKIPNKFLAGAIAVVAMGIHLWNASLNATQRESEIDHRWLGHQN